MSDWMFPSFYDTDTTIGGFILPRQEEWSRETSPPAWEPPAAVVHTNPLQTPTPATQAAPTQRTW